MSQNSYYTVSRYEKFVHGEVAYSVVVLMWATKSRRSTGQKSNNPLVLKVRDYSSRDRKTHKTAAPANVGRKVPFIEIQNNRDQASEGPCRRVQINPGCVAQFV